MFILRKAFTVMMLALLLASMLTWVFSVQPFGTSETINAQADDSIGSSTAPVEQEASILSEAPPTEWNKTYGTPESDFLALIRTSDGGYAMGGYTYGGNPHADSWLVKANALGIEQWDESYGAYYFDDAISDVIQTSDGGYIAAGYANMGAATPYGRLVCTYPNGTLRWNMTYEYGYFDALVQTNDGGYAMAGRNGSFWLVKTDSLGGETWSKAYGDGQAWALLQTSDGGYAMTGVKNNHVWLVKTYSNGTEQWDKPFGGPLMDGAYALLQTKDGGYAVAGYRGNSTAGMDFWLIKTDVSGNEQWNKTYGGLQDDCAFAMVQTSDEGYALAGYTYESGNSDVWVVKTDASGNMQWNKTYGKAYREEARGIVQNPDGSYVIAGFTYSYGSGAPTRASGWLIKTAGTNGTIYIRADGSIYPSTAPVSTSDNVTYVLTGNITSDGDGIVIERDSIIVDGVGYTVQGMGNQSLQLRGVDLYNRNNVTIKGMQIRGFYYGVFLDTYSEYFDTITENTIAYNRYGLVVFTGGAASRGLVFHNNFINNTNQVLIDGIATYDDGYPSCGNYWSDYNGSDLYRGPNQNEAGADGIGDTPKDVAYGIFYDNYPLMRPWPFNPPIIALLSPQPGTYNTNDVLLTFTINRPTSWIGYSLNDEANVTITGNTTLDLGSSPPEYHIVVYANDTAGNMGQSSIVYFSVDTMPPYISIISPENETYASADVPLTFSAWDYSGIFWEGYSLDGQANVTIHGNGTLVGLPEGPHTLVVYATDFCGNTRWTEATHFSVEIHDVALTDILSSKTIICQGCDMNVSVAVLNQGNYTEALDLTVYANETKLTEIAQLELANMVSLTVNFTWNTTGFAKGSYTLWAYVLPVAGEIDTADNNLTGGRIVVSMIGDLTGGTPNVWDFVPDGKVSGMDISVVARCFGSSPQTAPPLRWEPNCDLNNNGHVDGTDVATVARHFGEADP